MFYEVIPEGKVEALTYRSDEELRAGQIVMVPLGRRVVPGVVERKVTRPSFATKPVAKILYTEPLPKQIMAAIRFVRDYYLAVAGEVVSMVLPSGVEKTRRKKTLGQNDKTEVNSHGAKAEELSHNMKAGIIRCDVGSESQKARKEMDIQLNPAQKKALEALQEAPGATRLLLGITGSGKTNIYLKLAENALKNHQSVILLVPEIALTGQLVQVFRRVFGEKILLIHSRQTEAERHAIFNYLLKNTRSEVHSGMTSSGAHSGAASSEVHSRVASSGAHSETAESDIRSEAVSSEAGLENAKPNSLPQSVVVVGPRSALLAPLQNLGLIIIDEEHEGTYYQESTPHYSAVRLASAMATSLKIPLILGSATPNIEDYYLAKQRKSLVLLTKKAKTTAREPKISVTDFKEKKNFRRNRYFSDELLAAIKRNLEQKQQTLIFHNRRGSSTMTVCENCGEEILCPNCFLPLTLHADDYQLVCHTCGFHQAVPSTCPKCGTPDMVHKGFGTKLLETELQKLFPRATIRRFDADNKKDETLDMVYDEVKNGNIDILVGTQTLTKGLDLPKLATVGVVQADAGLMLPDFSSEERVFQLLTQVIGRVGRGHLETAEVFIQTYRPEHPVIQYAIAEDFLAFAKYIEERRRQSGFPPFKFILKLDITLKTEAIVLRKVRETMKKLQSNPRLIVSPPMPAFHERTSKGYTWEIIVRSRVRKDLIEAAKGLDKNFKITLDPPSLL